MRIISYLFACVLACTLIADDKNISQEQKNVRITPAQQMTEVVLHSLSSSEFDFGDNLDVSYLNTLIAYYQDMMNASDILIKHSNHQKVRNIANHIIKTYKAEILSFESLLPLLMEQKKLYSPKEVTLFNNSIKDSHKSLLEEMYHLEQKNINRNFLLILIFYHQASFDISKEVLQYTQIEEVKAIAERIFTTYEQDIESFQSLLRNIR